MAIFDPSGGERRGERPRRLALARGRAGRSACARYARAISPPGAPASSATSRQARPVPRASHGSFRFDAGSLRSCRVVCDNLRPGGSVPLTTLHFTGWTPPTVASFVWYVLASLRGLQAEGLDRESRCNRQRNSGCGYAPLAVPRGDAEREDPSLLRRSRDRASCRVERDPGGQRAGGQRPCIRAAPTRRGEGLRETNPDLAAWRPRRTERRLHAHGLADGERVRLRVRRAAVHGPDDELEAALGSGCSVQDAGCRERDARRKRSRLQGPSRLHVGAGGRVQARDLLRRECLGIGLADRGRLDRLVDDRESGVDRDAEFALRFILELAPGRSALRRGQVAIPQPETRVRRRSWGRRR